MPNYCVRLNFPLGRKEDRVENAKELLTEFGLPIELLEENKVVCIEIDNPS